MKNLRNVFPILSHNTYLNTAASGILYDSLLDFRQECDLEFILHGSKIRDHQQMFLKNVRQTIGSFLGASEENIILTPNFSLGINTILNGLEKKRKILLLDTDYPSLNFAVTNKGFEVCYAQVNASLEQNIVEAIEKHAPDILAISIIQYISGIMIDLNFLQTLKATYPKLLIIADGTQFCGTKDFDFDSSGIDILGCSGYKWLLGGYGNGFFLFKNEILERITPNSYKKSALEMDYDDSYTNLQARFQCGHLDNFNFGSLQHSLKFLTQIGILNIENSIKEVSDYARVELSKLELLDKEVMKRPVHSSIYNIRGDEKLFNTLKKAHIITSLRGSGIRISLHFYNTKEDIDKLIDNL
ncbi:aminotransferase class V-fold PLP-dependent enzyme [Aquimarina pacifica]|uniref:aminotransferase class V-fold PLP-dependent enzyme n=1 Tax=Aquimarina pacifica TaxID=1296415 RepID=UPI0004AD71AB|nr:aminotransferase class V-fold PLP-dependent enzyme [Aquimarina pacifica]